MLLWIFGVFLVGLASASTSYVISDINYEAPYCAQQQPNTLGQLTIENDHLARHLTLRTDFFAQPLRSCRFCELNQSYCGDRQLDPSLLRFSPNAWYNFRLVALDASAHSYASYDASIQTRFALDTPASEQRLTLGLQQLYGHQQPPHCGQQLSLVVGLVLYYESMDTVPIHRRDLASSVHHQTDAEPLWCDGQNRLFPDLPCHNQPLRFYRINYRLENCLALQPQREHAPLPLPPPPLPGTVLDQPPALHFYNSFLVYNAPLPAQHKPLCGRDWPQLLYESNLYHYYCDGGGVSAFGNESRDPYYLMRPWHHMAMEWISLQMLGVSEAQRQLSPLYHFVRERHYMSLAQDLLERNCATRQEWGLFLGRQEFYQEIMMALMTLSNYSNRRPQYSRLDVVCGELRSYFERQFPRDSLTLQYTQLGERVSFNSWYHKSYNHLVMPNARAETNAILLTTFFCVAGVATLVGLVAVRWNLLRRLTRRCRQSAKTRLHDTYRKIV
jgi:hypothetical protein